MTTIGSAHRLRQPAQATDFDYLAPAGQSHRAEKIKNAHERVSFCRQPEQTPSIEYLKIVPRVANFAGDEKYRCRM